MNTSCRNTPQEGSNRSVASVNHDTDNAVVNPYIPPSLRNLKSTFDIHCFSKYVQNFSHFTIAIARYSVTQTDQHSQTFECLPHAMPHAMYKNELGKPYVN